MKHIIAWLRVIMLGVIVKIPVKLAAPFAYPFIDKVNHPIWGVRDATDLSFYNIAIRNSAHNLFTRQNVPYRSRSNSGDHTLEQANGLQWRYRHSEDGKYVSFRMTWGKIRPKKGKKEFYIGWTMNELPTFRLTFFQLRPF